MVKPLFVATADWHLDDLIWADRPKLRGDTYWAFAQICDFAIEKQIPIVAAGDLLDKKRNDSSPVAEVVTQMDRLYETPSLCYFIQGQHELAEPPWLSAIHDWPGWLMNYSVVSLGGYKVWGLDWMPPGRLEEELAKVPEDTDIVVMHQVCHHWMGGITSPELDFAMVPHAKLLIVGDYHKHDKVKAHNKQGKKMLVLSPGSIAMQSIDEERLKRFFVVFDDLSVRSVRLKTRPVIDCIPLTCEEDVDHFVENIAADVLAANAQARVAGIPEGIQEPIVYVSYDVTIPDVYARITKAMPEGAHLFRKEILPEDEEDDGVTTEYRTGVLEAGLIGCLPDVIDPKEEPETYSVCHALLSTDDPGAVLSGIRKEWIGGDDDDEEETD